MEPDSVGPTPYHVVPGPFSTKRILLISYHAPPSNEVGAMRWAGMARRFAEHGWGFDILALDPAAVGNTDAAALDRLPPGTRLYGIPRTTRTLDRAVDGFVEIRRRVKAMVFGPPSLLEEEEIGALRQHPSAWRRLVNSFHARREYLADGDWARAAARVGLQLHDPKRHQWVISSGPPHMSHEGGRLLSMSTGLPLIADFRDAWRFQEWVPLGPTWAQLAARHEARVVRQSTLVVANVEPVRELMQRAYPEARIVTITNGVDDVAVPAPNHGDRFIIGYPGTIYVGRDPTPLFQAVAQMVESERLTPEQVGLEFMGHSGPAVEEWLRRLAEEHGLGDFLLIRAGGPRPRALEFMATCAVLVAFQQGSDLAVPAKIFEYMKFAAWLVVLATAGSATGELLAGTEAAVVDPGNIPALAGILSARYRAFSDGRRPVPLGGEARFGRRFQADRLLDSMNAATEGARPGRKPRRS